MLVDFLNVCTLIVCSLTYRYVFLERGKGMYKGGVTGIRGGGVGIRGRGVGIIVKLIMLLLRG